MNSISVHTIRSYVPLSHISLDLRYFTPDTHAVVYRKTGKKSFSEWFDPSPNTGRTAFSSLPYLPVCVLFRSGFLTSDLLHASFRRSLPQRRPPLGWNPPSAKIPISYTSIVLFSLFKEIFIPPPSPHRFWSNIRSRYFFWAINFLKRRWRNYFSH
jgi:hypothetical protein